MSNIEGYKGSRFYAGDDQPLLHDTWEALSELNPDDTEIWLEVLAGAKYRRQLSELAQEQLHDNPNYVLQIIFKLQNVAEMSGEEYLDKSRSLLTTLPRGSISMLLEGSFTAPKYEGPFGAANEENNAWYIHEPSRCTIERKTGGRTLILAGVASPLPSGFRAYNYADWITQRTVSDARKGGLVFDTVDIRKNGIPLDS